MNTDVLVLVLGFYTVCRLKQLTTFRKPLWVPSSLVMSHDSCLYNFRQKSVKEKDRLKGLKAEGQIIVKSLFKRIMYGDEKGFQTIQEFSWTIRSTLSSWTITVSSKTLLHQILGTNARPVAIVASSP
jgi:hypothetical protein